VSHKLIKDYYTISEIGKLFDIGNDSLRYYEKLGVITPERGANGYRLYHLKDIYKLNTIRTLRGFGFSMDVIKEYLETQTVAATRALLDQEEHLLQEQIEALKKRQKLLRMRKHELDEALAQPVGVIREVKEKRRPFVQTMTPVYRDEEMDLLMRKLATEYEPLIKDFANHSFGAFIDVDALAEGHNNVYSSIFFSVEGREVAVAKDLAVQPSDEEGDGEKQNVNRRSGTKREQARSITAQFQSGTYLSVFYRGNYHNRGNLVERLYDYTSEKGLQHDGKPFEIYYIDNRDTQEEEEFLTEIQLHVWQQ